MDQSVNQPIISLKSSRLAGASAVSVRTRMTEIAAGLTDVVLLGRGDPDLATPPHIIEAAKKAVDEGATHYTHIRGTIELRRAIANKLKRDNNLDYDPETEIMVTVGAEEAVFLALFALINPGDEVLVPSPRYTSYDEAIQMWGGKVVVVPSDPDDNFTFRPEAIRKCITPRSKIISLVNPGNPIGMLDAPILYEIAEIAKEHNLMVISDEIYENIIFDDTKHLSMAAIPGMRERTITINGVSKSYAMTGWRCGYLAAARPLPEMLTEPAHTISICCPAVTQAAALAAYEGPQDCVVEMRNEYDRRRRYMMGVLDELGMKYINPRAGFYLFTDVTSLGLTPEEFCVRLLQENRVMIFPGSLFADPTDRFVRISLLAPFERIKLGGERLREFVANLKR